MSEPLAALLTTDGEELLALLAGYDVTPEVSMRLGAELRGHYPADLVAAALTQQSLRMAAREKFGRAEQMLFTRAGLEQASSDLTAAHSARRFAGRSVVADLCCGIGGNLAALAGSAEHVVAFDADLTALRFARRNAAALAPAATVRAVCADVRTLAFAAGRQRPGASRSGAAGVQAIYVDPARRTPARRLRAADCKRAIPNQRSTTASAWLTRCQRSASRPRPESRTS